MHLYCESWCASKRHGRDIGRWRRLDYLTQIELKIAARISNASKGSTMWAFWWEKTKVAILSIRMRFLKEKFFESTKRIDAFKYCKNVYEAHKQGKLQGKDVVWDFVKDIFHNLMHPKARRRYSTLTKSLYEMIKIWGGPRLHSFIILCNIKNCTLCNSMWQVALSSTSSEVECHHLFPFVHQGHLVSFKLEFYQLCWSVTFRTLAWYEDIHAMH